MRRSTLRALSILAGVLLIIAGVVCLCHQETAVLSAGILLGAFMLVSGIVEIVLFVRWRDFYFGSAGLLLDGILTVLLSLFLLFNRAFTLLSLPMLFAMWLLFSGVMRVVEFGGTARAGHAPLGLGHAAGRGVARRRFCWSHGSVAGRAGAGRDAGRSASSSRGWIPSSAAGSRAAERCRCPGGTFRAAGNARNRHRPARGADGPWLHAHTLHARRRGAEWQIADVTEDGYVVRLAPMEAIELSQAEMEAIGNAETLTGSYRARVTAMIEGEEVDVTNVLPSLTAIFDAASVRELDRGRSGAAAARPE